MAPDLSTLRAGFAQTWSDVAAVCADLTPEQWKTPTELAGWSVQDNVSHIVGEESFLLGDATPVHEVPDLPHLRSDFARAIELPIDYRRSHPGDEVLRELQEVAARRLAVLDSYTDASLEEELPFAGRTMPLRNVLGIRLFDCWTHSQDIRHALGRPGGFENPAADLSRRRLLRALSRLADDVPSAAGRTVVFETTHELPSVSTLRLGTEPSYAEGDDPAADVRIRTSFDVFRRLATGRVHYDDVSEQVTLEGDTALGTELARTLAVTP